MTISRGMVRVTEKGHRLLDKRYLYAQRSLKEFDLDLPEEIFTTAAVWMEVSDDIIEEIDACRI